MKKWTKLMAMLLLAAMLCTLGASAFAEENSAASASIIDDAALQKMIDDFVAQHSLNTRNRSLCVGFCYLRTGDMWFYNEDKWCYSASLYKVPVSMLLAEREVKGEIAPDYVFQNQYQSGTLDQLEMKALVNSDNDAGHALVEWMGGTYAGKCADQIVKYTDLPDSYFNQDFYSVSYYNVNFYTQVLRTLYNNQQNYPRILDYMKQMKTGDGIPDLGKNLGGIYQVAQKYGSFEEVKTNPTKNNKHVGGIIYTPNPIAVTIMTVNVDNYTDRIGELAKMLADYSLTLDAKYASYQAEQARAAQEEADRLAREEQERLAAQAAQQQALLTPAPVATAQPNASVFLNDPGSAGSTSASSSGGIKGFLSSLESTQKIIIIAGLAVFVIGLVLLIVALIIRRRRSDEYDYDDYDDYDDYEDEEDDDAPITPPVSKRSSRKMTKHEEEYFDDLPQPEEDLYYDPEEYVQEGQYEDASDYDASYEDYEGDYEGEYEGGYEDAAYEEELPAEEDAGYEEEYSEDLSEDYGEYLEDNDYLEADSFLDASDYDDFKAEFDLADYGSYLDDFADEEPDSDASSSGGRRGSRH